MLFREQCSLYDEPQSLITVRVSLCGHCGVTKSWTTPPLLWLEALIKDRVRLGHWSGDSDASSVGYRREILEIDILVARCAAHQTLVMFRYIRYRFQLALFRSAEFGQNCVKCRTKGTRLCCD